jgi:hypothetical protein
MAKMANNFLEDFKFEFEDYAIGGKMITGTFTVTAEMMVQIRSDAEFAEYVKMQMANRLAEAMVDNKLLEFTMQEDYTHQQKHVRVRGFMTPNEQVKILRMHRPSKLT